ncbi:uncharacterized protein [Chanodichthys erythropterus]|uniref:uncharacterized protein n=1 Tax=Chanodichthys erythropterus TaxID=933992 RepID=UPI00351E9666
MGSGWAVVVGPHMGRSSSSSVSSCGQKAATYEIACTKLVEYEHRCTNRVRFYREYGKGEAQKEISRRVILSSEDEPHQAYTSIHPQVITSTIKKKENRTGCIHPLICAGSIHPQISADTSMASIQLAVQLCGPKREERVQGLKTASGTRGLKKSTMTSKITCKDVEKAVSKWLIGARDWGVIDRPDRQPLKDLASGSFEVESS